MKIIILEGMATSGKSTITKSLYKKLSAQGKRVRAVTEAETLMPILHDTSLGVNLRQCEDLLAKYSATDCDYLIFDRFYFTHIFRSQAEAATFNEVLAELMGQDTLAVLLTIPESQIEHRIFSSTAHRDPSWEDFIMKKGETREDITEYYVEQQQLFLNLFAETKLNHIIIDSSKNNFGQIADEILARAS